MALTMWGQVVIQTAIPSEDPVMVGTLWADTSGAAVAKICTSVSPYTFVSVVGGGTLDDLTDVAITAAASGDYLRHNGTNWVDVPASQLATDLAASFAALVHATRHQSGGADPIALDTLAAPTDVTTLNASTSTHGLLVKAVAPASGIQSVPAIRNGETAYVVREMFDSTNPAALGTAAPGTSLIAARRDHVHTEPALTDLDGTLGVDHGGTGVTTTNIARARAGTSGTQSINTGAVTTLALPTEDFDTNAMHDTVTDNSHIKAVIAGKYLVSANVSWSAQSTTATLLLMRILMNGSIASGGQSMVSPISSLSSNGQSMAAAVVLDMAVNDYVELAVYHDNVTTALTVDKAGCILTLTRLGT